MKTANRVQRKAGKKTVSTQAGTSPKAEPVKPLAAAPAQSFLNPSDILSREVDAEFQFYVCLSEAESTAFLLAAQFDHGIKSYDEYSVFQPAKEFAQGLYLATSAMRQEIERRFDAFNKGVATLRRYLKDVNDPVPAPALSDEQCKSLLAGLGFVAAFDVFLELEESGYALCDLLGIMGTVASHLKGDGYYATEFVKKRLEDALRDVYKRRAEFRELAAAVAWQRAGEQSAAA